MMYELKTGFRLMKYGYGSKLFLIIFAFQFIVGMCFTLLDEGNIWMGSYLILVAPLWPVQILYSLAAAKIVQTSALNRKLETSIPAVMSTLLLLVFYSIFLGIRVSQISAGVRTAELVANELVITSIMIIFLMVYMALAYKFFYTSVVLFVLAVILLAVFSNFFQNGTVQLSISLPVAMLCGYVSVLLGGALQYLCSCLCYRVPLSKSAQVNALRKQL